MNEVPVLVFNIIKEQWEIIIEGKSYWETYKEPYKAAASLRKITIQERVGKQSFDPNWNTEQQELWSKSQQEAAGAFH